MKSFLIILTTLFCSVLAEEIIRLSKLKVKENDVTVMGFSAGCSMASQLHVAHSSLFSGVGLFSNAVWRCGHESLDEFISQCSILRTEVYDVKNSFRDAENYEAEGLIDSLANMRNHKVFVHIGKLDEYVNNDAALKNVDFYGRYVRNKKNIHSYVDPNQTHSVPTETYGNPCNESADSFYYLGNCGYSLPFRALRFLHGNQIRPPKYGIQLSPLRKYNQAEFYNGNISEIAMGDVGYIYIPDKCNHKRCLLNFFFHGCNEYPPAAAEIMIRNSGFLEIAELSNVIVVFPLASLLPTNNGGCWDFFSYTGDNFATKNGAQIQVAYQIYQRIVRGSKTIF